MDGLPSGERLPSLVAGQRIGDAEREEAATALSEHFAAGRLERDEFDVRLGAAYVARTAADLQPLFTDLPAPTPRGSSPVPTEVSRRRARRVFAVPVFPLLLLVAVVTTVATGYPFFIFPMMLWFRGGLRRRRSW
jgi:Domain of unknown function (DUF1707)